MAALRVRVKDSTDKHKILSLLNKLHPVSCDRPLIRLGAFGDGGYLVPDDLTGIEACFSPGVGFSSVFEKDCADRGMKVFMADGFVNHPSLSHELFVFIKKYIGNTDNDHEMTLDAWVNSSLADATGDLLLQMDIEGAEYDVLSAVSEDLLKRFRIIVIEFHLLDGLRRQPFFNLASQVFEKILRTHTCVHNHPNNCSDAVKVDDIDIPMVMELTFLRNDRIHNPSFVRTFPHPLDCDNTDRNPSLVLPKSWYRNHQK